MRGHVRQRGKTYCFVVDIGRDPETDKRRQRWHSGYRTRKEAEAALTEEMNRLQTGTYVPPSRRTVAAFLREWLESTRPTLRESTWMSYALNVDSYVIPRLGSGLLQNLTPAALNGLYADLLAEGRRTRAGGLSKRSVRYVHTIIRKALADGVRWNRLARNVADQADPPAARATKAAEMRTWSADELRRFLEHVRDERLYGAWRLIATTGMRRGEVLGLRWRDVDLQAGRVAVRQTLIAVRNAMSFSGPKTDRGRRSVALDAQTAAVLRQHRNAALEERLQWGPAYDDHDLVFCQESGRPIHPDLFSEWFERHARAAGLPRIRLHDLRHTHATLALGAGVHPKVVSERLGHATVSITLDTYSHAIPALQEEAAEKVAALLS